MKTNILVLLLMILFLSCSSLNVPDAEVESTVVVEDPITNEHPSPVPDALDKAMCAARYDLDLREVLIKNLFQCQLVLIVKCSKGDIDPRTADIWWNYYQGLIDELFDMYQMLEIL